jgi:hypothetical protein
MFPIHGQKWFSTSTTTTTTTLAASWAGVSQQWRDPSPQLTPAIRSAFIPATTVHVTVTDDRIVSRRDDVVIRTLGFAGPDEKGTGCPRLVSGYGVSKRTRAALIARFGHREPGELEPPLSDALSSNFLHPPGSPRNGSHSRSGSLSRLGRRLSGRGSADASPSHSPKPSISGLPAASEKTPPPPSLPTPPRPHSATTGPAVPLLHVDGQTVLKPWFGELARLFLVEVDVRIEVALRGEEPFIGHKGRCTVSALTALFLAMRVREEAAACSFVFDLGEELIAAEIREHGLGGFVGACTTRLVVSDTMHRIAKRRMYSIAYGGLKAARDMLVAYMIREGAGAMGPSSVHAKSAALFDMILDTPASLGRKGGLNLADIDLLATRMGLVYGALVATVVENIAENGRRARTLGNAVQALTKLATAAAATGASMIPYGVAAAAVNDFTTQIGTVVVEGVTGNLKRHEEELAAALEIVCDKFNAEVLHAAELGHIADLDIYSDPVGHGPASQIVASPVATMAPHPPTMPTHSQSLDSYDVSPYGCTIVGAAPGDRIPRRPTASDVARFKATATNVLILMTRQEGVKLINNVIAINEPLQLMPGAGSNIIPSPAVQAPRLGMPRVGTPYGHGAYGAPAHVPPPPAPEPAHQVRHEPSTETLKSTHDGYPEHARPRPATSLHPERRMGAAGKRAQDAPPTPTPGASNGTPATAGEVKVGGAPPRRPEASSEVKVGDTRPLSEPETSKSRLLGHFHSAPERQQPHQPPAPRYSLPQQYYPPQYFPPYYTQQAPRFYAAPSSMLAANTRVSNVSMW